MKDRLIRSMGTRSIVTYKNIRIACASKSAASPRYSNLNELLAAEYNKIPGVSIEEAKSLGGAYVLKGTQMWNEPLGQIEESDKAANFTFHRDAY